MNKNENQEDNNNSKLNLRHHIICLFVVLALIFLSLFFARQNGLSVLAGFLFGGFAISGFVLFGWGTTSYSLRTGVWWTSGVILDKPLIKKEKLLFFYGVPIFVFNAIISAVLKV